VTNDNGRPEAAARSLIGERLAIAPVELRERPQWVGWREEQRNGRPTKVPCRSDSAARAAVDDSASWSTFEAAVRAVERGLVDGVGFVFTADDPFTGLDLDGCYLTDCPGAVGLGAVRQSEGVRGGTAPLPPCVLKDTGGGGSRSHPQGESEPGHSPGQSVLHPAAAAIVAGLDSYTERSPSGRGLHLLIAAQNAVAGRRTSSTEWGSNLEVYSAGRFFAVTGDQLPGSPPRIVRRQAELEALVDRYWPTRHREPSPAAPSGEVISLDDEQLLSRALRARNGQRFERLWCGDSEGYGSPSEADLALCAMLAFWSSRDQVQIDRLFRCSGLFRSKWDRRLRQGEARTYGDATIEKAVAGCKRVYQPRGEAARRIANATTFKDAFGAR
jgi:putative DNA primase/helicase